MCVSSSSSLLPYGSKVAAERRFAYRTAAVERHARETELSLSGLAVERLVTPRGVADDGGPRDWLSADAVQAMRGLWSVHREVLRRLPRCSSSTRRGVGGWAIDAPVLLVRQQACLLPLLQETFLGSSARVEAQQLDGSLSGPVSIASIREWPCEPCSVVVAEEVARCRDSRRRWTACPV